MVAATRNILFISFLAAVGCVATPRFPIRNEIELARLSPKPGGVASLAISAAIYRNGVPQAVPPALNQLYRSLIRGVYTDCGAFERYDPNNPDYHIEVALREYRYRNMAHQWISGLTLLLIPIREATEYVVSTEISAMVADAPTARGEARHVVVMYGQTLLLPIALTNQSFRLRNEAICGLTRRSLSQALDQLAASPPEERVARFEFDSELQQPHRQSLPSMAAYLSSLLIERFEQTRR